MNYVLRKIRAKDPDACVLMFTTLPVFKSGSDGYDPNATGAQSMHRYVEAEIEWCTRNSIPYLDLFRQSGLTYNNYGRYTLSDALHLNETGYELILPITTQFLQDNIQRQVGIDLPLQDNRSLPQGLFNLQGQPMKSIRRGFGIIRYEDGRIEKVLVTDGSF